MTGNFLVAERRLRIRYQEQEQRLAANGATLSFLRVPAKVPSPSDLPTFAIVRCKPVVC